MVVIWDFNTPISEMGRWKTRHRHQEFGQYYEYGGANTNTHTHTHRKEEYNPTK